MKRIFILMILAAAHLACFAQTNPKIEALYAYLKAQGVSKSYKLTNIDGDGLRKVISANIPIFDEKRLSADTKETKIDSAYRVLAIKNRDAINQIRRTIVDLQQDAVESYSYEYHQNGADTIINTMALKNSTNVNQSVQTYKSMYSPVPQVSRAPEYVRFEYLNMDKRSILSPYSQIAYASFRYNGIVDSTLEATKDFDIATLKKKIAPLFKDKSIKKHTMLCSHDSTFNREAYRDSLNRIGQYKKGYMILTTCSTGPGGESHFDIYKFTNEEHANTVLSKLMDCIRQQIDADPHQAYEVHSDAFFGKNNPITIFSAWPCSQTFNDYHEGKCKSPERMEIMTCMDPEGFYIIINTYHGDDSFPNEWKSLKEFVNGKKVYYKDSL